VLFCPRSSVYYQTRFIGIITLFKIYTEHAGNAPEQQKTKKYSKPQKQKRFTQLRLGRTHMFHLTAGKDAIGNDIAKQRRLLIVGRVMNFNGHTLIVDHRLM